MMRITPHFSSLVYCDAAIIPPWLVLCLVGLLDVLYKYDCGGSPRVVSVASLARTALATPRYDER